MQHNRELPHSQIFRSVNPAAHNLKGPQITTRGDNNLSSLGTSGVVRVNAGSPVDSALQPPRNGHWPQQILDAIRVKAIETRRSSDEVCEIAARVLGRAVVTLEKLSARELARIYEAVSASGGKA